MTEEQNSYSAPEPTVAPPTQDMGSTEGSPSNNEPGQGRRRRRRKRKGTRAAGAQSGQSGQNGQGQPQNAGQNGQPQSVFQQPSQSNFQQNGQQNGQNGQQNGQKSGKRFFRKQRNNQGGGQGNNGNGGGNGQQANPGNGNGGGQGRRRNGKQRRQPAAFVGPMDHSYRTANGNIADGPPSTIQLQNGNGYGNSYSSHGNGGYNPNVNGNLIGYGQAYPSDSAVVAISEDAPTRIYCYIEDLFFLAKIQETSRKLGIKVEFVKGDRELLAEILELPEEQRPGLIVFDLNNLNAKPLTLIPKFRSKLKKSTSIVGFVSHLQGDLKMKATEAGCDAVMPRSAFSQNLPNLLRRYGLDEVEEDDAQPF